jgi:hypothetical protein
MDCSSTRGAPWLALTRWCASHTSCLEMTNDFSVGLDLLTRLLPNGSRRPVARANKPRNEPATSLDPHYRSFPPTTSRSASRVPRRYSASPVSAVDALPLTHPALRAGSIGTGLPTFRAGAADQARAAYMPDTTWQILGHPPGSSRGLCPAPGFDAN